MPWAMAQTRNWVSNALLTPLTQVSSIKVSLQALRPSSPHHTLLEMLFSQVAQGVYTATPGSRAEPALCSFILSLFWTRNIFEHKTWPWRKPKKGTKVDSGQGQLGDFFCGDKDISPAQAMTQMPIKGLRDLVRVEEDTEVKKGERDMLVHREYQAELTPYPGLCPPPIPRKQ